MNQYVTGAVIKKLREAKRMTQDELAGIIGVSGKAVSKWETGRGYPDVSLLEPLSKALQVSVIELLSGNDVDNTNRCANMLRSKLYVCPICGNVLYSIGEAVVSCHGIILPPLTPEIPDENHRVSVSVSEDEYYIEISHGMTRDHYISFIAGISDNGVQVEKLYPEGACSARLKISRTHKIMYYCSRDGLYLVPTESLRR